MAARIEGRVTRRAILPLKAENIPSQKVGFGVGCCGWGMGTAERAAWMVRGLLRALSFLPLERRGLSRHQWGGPATSAV